LQNYYTNIVVNICLTAFAFAQKKEERLLVNINNSFSYSVQIIYCYS